MEMPYELQAAINEIALEMPTSALAAAAKSLSQRYREDVRDGHSLLTGEIDAFAYAGARMPATYTAIYSALLHASIEESGYTTLLDAGAGTGAASWATAEALPTLKRIDCVEREDAMLTLGQRLMKGASLFDGIDVSWQKADITAIDAAQKYDIVISSYMTNEMDEGTRLALIDKLWSMTSSMLLILEPGTPEGFRIMRGIRERVLSLGGHIAAPCPCEGACPMPDSDWCHVTCRVQRTKLHKYLKGGSAPYEDEKYCYMAFTRAECAHCASRVLRHPQIQNGRITLELCTPQGLKTRIVTKREKPIFHVARKVECGDEFACEGNVGNGGSC